MFGNRGMGCVQDHRLAAADRTHTSGSHSSLSGKRGGKSGATKRGHINFGRIAQIRNEAPVVGYGGIDKSVHR